MNESEVDPFFTYIQSNQAPTRRGDNLIGLYLCCFAAKLPPIQPQPPMFRTSPVRSNRELCWDVIKMRERT